MSKLKIGWASRDVSTTRPVKLAGQFHVRISQGVAEPLYTTALVLDDGNDYVIFTSLDIVTVRCGIVDYTRYLVTDRHPEIDPLKIIINATHTHTAPSIVREDPEAVKAVVGDAEIAPNAEYREFVCRKMADAICEAWENRTEGKLGYGYGYAVVAHSRRVIYFDDVSTRPDARTNGAVVNGHGVMYGNTNDDNFSHYEAGADHFVNLMYTFDPAGRLTGAIINVPCPSQNSEQEYKISADYWADVREAVRKKHGDIFILPQCAAAGDLSPRTLHYKSAEARRFGLKYGSSVQNVERAARRDIAERISCAFDEVLSWAKNELFDELPIRHVTKTLMLQRRHVSDEDYAYAQGILDQADQDGYKTEGMSREELINYNSLLQTRRRRAQTVIKQWNKERLSPCMPIEVHALRVGNISFATNPFELYMDYQHRIQARSPFEQTFIVQLTGIPGEEAGTYLPTKRGLANKGYSASLFDGRVSPDGGQMLVDETVKILKDIK